MTSSHASPDASNRPASTSASTSAASVRESSTSASAAPVAVPDPVPSTTSAPPNDATPDTPAQPTSTMAQASTPIGASSATSVVDAQVHHTVLSSLISNPNSIPPTDLISLNHMNPFPITPQPRTGATTVNPSDISGLPNDPGTPSHHALQQSPAPMKRKRSEAFESYAKLEFEDGTFYMTTYAVIIGRDQRAMKQAKREEQAEQKYKKAYELYELHGGPIPEPIPPDMNKAFRQKYSRSYISEEGGILGPAPDGDVSDDDSERQPKRRKSSTAGSLALEEGGQDVVTDRQYVEHTAGAVPVDPDSLKTSSEMVPFIPVHAPGPEIYRNTKAISRHHLRIEYNKDKGVFEAIPIGRNGLFIDDNHYKPEDGPITLRSGSHLQIREVSFHFVITGVRDGCTGGNNEQQPQEDMSFEFENSHANPSEDDIAAVDKMEPSSEDVLPPQLPRKRGPGRPPKNGYMSKREQRLLKKQQQEEEARRNAAQLLTEPPTKRPVGRPRKYPLPEGEQPEKRKYNRRKAPEDGFGSDTERRVKKEKKPIREKTPPLNLVKEDYTAEQLQKPNKNYCQIIYEILEEYPDGLTLKQIYKRICERHPYYFFEPQTKGWESSVRHNLGGHPAFAKDESTGLWKRTGHEIDAGKKRRQSPPVPPPVYGPAQTMPAPIPAYIPMSEPSRTYTSPYQQPPSQQPPVAVSTPMPVPGPGTVPASAQAASPVAAAAPAQPSAPTPAVAATPTSVTTPTAMTPTTGAAVEKSIDTRLIEALAHMKDGVVPKLREKCDQADAIMLSAITRNLGLFDKSAISGTQEAAEQMAFTVVSQFINRFRASNGVPADAPLIHPPLLAELKRYKGLAMDSMRSHPTKGEILVLSALSRSLGLSKNSMAPAGFDRAEKVIMDTFENVLKKYR